MIRKLPSLYPNHIRVVFELPSCLWADRIFLVGDFNQWNERATPMRQQRDGVWRAEIELPAGSRSEFRYLIDGQWRSDSHADGFAGNTYGANNSVVMASLPAGAAIVERSSSQVCDVAADRPPLQRNRLPLRSLHLHESIRVDAN